jgi:hypothetical protein
MPGHRTRRGRGLGQRGARLVGVLARGRQCEVARVVGAGVVRGELGPRCPGLTRGGLEHAREHVVGAGIVGRAREHAAQLALGLARLAQGPVQRGEQAAQREVAGVTRQLLCGVRERGAQPRRTHAHADQRLAREPCVVPGAQRAREILLGAREVSRVCVREARAVERRRVERVGPLHGAVCAAGQQRQRQESGLHRAASAGSSSRVLPTSPSNSW